MWLAADQTIACRLAQRKRSHKEYAPEPPSSLPRYFGIKECNRSHLRAANEEARHFLGKLTEDSPHCSMNWGSRPMSIIRGPIVQLTRAERTNQSGRRQDSSTVEEIWLGLLSALPRGRCKQIPSRCQWYLGNQGVPTIFIELQPSSSTCLPSKPTSS